MRSGLLVGFIVAHAFAAGRAALAQPAGPAPSPALIDVVREGHVDVAVSSTVANVQHLPAHLFDDRSHPHRLPVTSTGNDKPE